MTETEQVIDALESVERYLRNQDLSPIGMQVKGKVLEALNRVNKNFVLTDVRQISELLKDFVKYIGRCGVDYTSDEEIDELTTIMFLIRSKVADNKGKE